MKRQCNVSQLAQAHSIEHNAICTRNILAGVKFALKNMKMVKECEPDDVFENACLIVQYNHIFIFELGSNPLFHAAAFFHCWITK